MTKYDDLMELEKKFRFTKQSPDNANFNLKINTFAIFTKKELPSDFSQLVNQNWKIHMSINNADLARAWDDVLFPILSEHADHFKVVNNHLFERNKAELQEQIDAGKDIILSLEENLESPEFNYEKWFEKARTLCSGESKKQLAFLDDIESNDDRNRQLAAFVREKIQTAYITNPEKYLSEIERMEDGMQVTLYIPPGKEGKYLNLADQIEQKLAEVQIRPGNIYRTDRPLGQFISARHPGIDYHEAVTAADYNPEKHIDPFLPLVSTAISSYKEEIHSMADRYLQTEINEEMDTEQQSENSLLIKLGHALKKTLSSYEDLGEQSFKDRRQLFLALKEDVNECFNRHARATHRTQMESSSSNCSTSHMFKQCAKLTPDSVTKEESALTEDVIEDDWSFIEKEDAQKEENMGEFTSARELVEDGWDILEDDYQEFNEKDENTSTPKKR